MRLSPLAAIAAACVLTLTACGDDDSEPESSDKSDSPSASPSSDAPTKGKGKDKGKDKGDQGDTGDLGANVCTSLDADEFGDVIGVTFKKGDVGSGCRFADPTNPVGASVGITQTLAEGAGGIEGAEQAVGVFVKGKPEPVDIGDDAFVVVGKGLVGNTVSGAAVVVDSELIQVTVTPAGEVAKDQLKDQTIALLELVAEAV
ncbi:MAG TPA: hypothetical protein VFO49_20975 [Nocardioides sp.]|nr:hypothetical protein [Nocardioides sp.]